MDSTPREANTAYFNEVCANIRQIKTFQWQVVVVSVAMLAAVPAVGETQSDTTLAGYIEIAKLAFCVIAVIYAVWHIHRYQQWLTYEREHRGYIQNLWVESGHLHKQWESMHEEKWLYPSFPKGVST